MSQDIERQSSVGEERTLQPGDTAILEYLTSVKTEYVAMIAARTGLHPPYVCRRCVHLEACGLVENVRDNVLYRITERGCDYLDENCGRTDDG